MAYFSLAKQLSELVANDDMHDLLMDCAEGEEREEGMDGDVLDGAVYKSMAPTLFKNKLDIALELFIDGFVPFEGGDARMTIVHVVIMNLPALKR